MKQFRMKSYVLFFFVATALLGQSCISIRLAKIEKRARQDSTGIYSTHPSRPFKYGYAIKREEVEDYKIDLLRTGIKNGETVASVGAASGWQEGIFSVMTDSVHYYVQDIDTVCLNQDQFSKVVHYYDSLRERPQTNSFHWQLGKATNTLLPDHTFDRIIIINAFHEIYKAKNSDRIIMDIRDKLLSHGSVVVSDETANIYKGNLHEGCNQVATKASVTIELFKKHGFYLTGMTEPENSFFNDLTFELDETKGDRFEQKRETVRPWMELLDRFHEKTTYEDSVQTNIIIARTKPRLKELEEVYPYISDYLTSIANELPYKIKNIPYIKNILRANLVLFPQSVNTNIFMGEVYEYEKDYESAKRCYETALTQQPEDTYIKKLIEDVAKKIAAENH